MFCPRAPHIRTAVPFIQNSSRLFACSCRSPIQVCSKMTGTGNSKGSEENNQLRPHPSETFPDVDAKTVDNNAGEDVSSKLRRRYMVSILVLASLMLATCLVQAMASSTNPTLQIITLFCSLGLGFYVYQWVFYFSDGLTQRKRAYFDVRNVMETYQPNKFTKIFEPEPPTPNVQAVTSTDVNRDGNVQSSSEIRDMREGGFHDWRKELYRNEYTQAMENAPTDGQDEIHNEEMSNDTQELSITEEDEPEAAREKNEEQQPEPAKGDQIK